MVNSGATDTPYQYVQGVFDILERNGERGFIIMRNVPFDSVQVRWPLDGTLYKWEALLIRTTFKVPEFILRRLVD